MYQKSLYDITEVCKMLGTTSRTLRFYEEKGIIQSTTLGTSARRQYSEEQLSLIKNVLVLRTLGLSV
ncbi:MAG: MerR family transcriptional regulator, partial [Clostridia bacterium]|nr:MerR family transcriptional regulator [Clostridia bacterium]